MKYVVLSNYFCFGERRGTGEGVGAWDGRCGYERGIKGKRVCRGPRTRRPGGSGGGAEVRVKDGYEDQDASAKHTKGLARVACLQETALTRVRVASIQRALAAKTVSFPFSGPVPQAPTCGRLGSGPKDVSPSQ